MKHNTSSQNMTTSKISLLGIVLICALALGISFLWSQRAAAAPLHATTVADQIPDQQCNGGFFGLEPWYHFMPNSEIGVPPTIVNGDVTVPADPCAIKCFNIFVQGQHNPNYCGETQSDIPGVILAVIDDLLRIAGLVAVAFIIIGAFQYVGSRGNAEKTAAAQGTVFGALTGLAVTLVAVALVSFIGSQLKG